MAAQVGAAVTRSGPISVVFAIIVIAAIAVGVVYPAYGDEHPAQSPFTLWYGQPAGPGMNEALPIGNGRLGGLVYGGLAGDRIVFNEDSLWTGDRNASGDYATMGAYQKFGEIDVNLPGHDTATAYRRDLDLTTATAHVQYRLNGTTYYREYFASHPAQALIIRLTADRPGAYTGSISLDGAHGETTGVTRTNRLAFTGALPNGIAYEAQLQVIAGGGRIAQSGVGVSFERCDSLTLVLGAGTSYVMDYARNYQGVDPHARVTGQVDRASAEPYDQLRREHIADYQSLFDRIRLDLGKSSPERASLPTDARKILAEHGNDPEMDGLLFQYGRYLLISCSRPGSLPANLQGLWNDSNAPPWASDYHTDINIEMNYWPGEAANLSECQVPLFDLIDSQAPSWRTLTQAAPEYRLASGAAPTRGFDIRASFNIMGGMGWLWIKTAGAWLCQSYWEHYAFTGDKHFLATRAYPILKQTSEFWADHLKALPDGSLVVPEGWSPEHGDFEDGVSFNQETVWDLFTNTIEASEALGVDAVEREQITALRGRLLEPKIGRWGQLQEWMDDKDDPEDHHRHTSQLFGVYPGRQFTLGSDPDRLQAGRVSLLHRGDTGDVTEWAFAWRAALFARMRDGDDAHRELSQFFADRNSCVNLFGFCPPMQIDGNFGITAAVCEMLLQSEGPAIDLLPALPSAWRTGSVSGLRARGGFTIDESWKDGELESVTVQSEIGEPCKLHYRGLTVELKLRAGESSTLNGSLQRGVR
jgi:alpha-L-fucosidase 2